MHDLDAAGLIETLGLAPHPEGGWYAQTWRDDDSSAIWFLLQTGERSHWHRVVGAVELWHHYRGDPVRLSMADAAGGPVRWSELGPDIEGGQRPQLVVPPGEWQSAESIPGSHGYALVGCTVAPPFHFDNFELAPPGWSPS